MWREDAKVAVSHTDQRGYPSRPPFNPPEPYPELPAGPVDPENRLYPSVRQTLYQLGLDEENFGTPQWNPLGHVVRPGMTVLIKPNTVRHNHPDGKDVFSIVTRASLIRPMLDYACIALRGEGRILVGDSQMVDSWFDEAWRVTGLAPLLEWYRQHTTLPIEGLDLREVRAVRTWCGGKWGREKVQQDPRGYQIVDLGERSNFRDIDPQRLRIGIADPRKTCECHSGGRHEYLFPKSVLAADAIISIPKLKTHRRAGVTLSIKGFFGLVAGRDALPHYQTGSVEEGGDEYIHPSLRKRLYSRFHDVVLTDAPNPVKLLSALARNAIWWSRKVVPFKDNVVEAMWHGNDTIWRTLHDIAHALFYTDKNGRLHETPQRGHFCLIDGIIGGQRNGPVNPDPITPGVLLAGGNPVAIDAVAASLMGFDVRAIPTIRNGLNLLNRDGDFFQDIEVVDDGGSLSMDDFLAARHLNYEPHPQWRGRLERPAGVSLPAQEAPCPC